MENWTLNSTNRKYIWITMILALLAIGFHSYLSYSYYGVKFGVATGESLCNINATFNCDVVTASNYSSLFGIPIALFGASLHGAFLLLCMTLLLGMSESQTLLARTLFFTTLFIAVVSIVMGFISMTAIGTYCLFCIAAYVISFLMAFAFSRVTPDFGFPNVGELLGNMKWVLVTLIAVPIGTAVLAHNMILDGHNVGEYKQIADESLLQWKNTKSYEFDLTKGLRIGNENAKMTIVEFADFLCPHCKSAAKPVKLFVQGRNDVQLVFKAFPLDGCKGTGIRCSLAKAVFCGDKQNLGWPTHDWIFAKQSEWQSMGVTRGLEMMSEEIGLDHKALMACVESEESKKAVEAQLKEGRDAKLQGTPTIYVNGKRLRGGQLPPVLEKVYQTL